MQFPLGIDWDFGGWSFWLGVVLVQADFYIVTVRMGLGLVLIYLCLTKLITIGRYRSLIGHIADLVWCWSDQTCIDNYKHRFIDVCSLNQFKSKTRVERAVSSLKTHVYWQYHDAFETQNNENVSIYVIAHFWLFINLLTCTDQFHRGKTNQWLNYSDRGARSLN